ncbi:MAG: ABC transporter permease [Planctomycetota bacterium]
MGWITSSWAFLVWTWEMGILQPIGVFLAIMAGLWASGRWSPWGSMRFLCRRLEWMALTLLIVFSISFFLMRSIPGGPFDRDKNIDPAIKARIEAKYGLDRPIGEQYLRSLADTLRGDLGPSYKNRDYDVVDIIAEGFPKSASLGVVALIFALTLGITAGMVSAVRRGGWLDTTLMVFATIGIALPNFVIASILILFLVILVPMFPAATWGDFRHLILPAFCLGAPFAAYVARLTRTGMLDVLTQDYIRTARAKGVGELRVLTAHALKGGLLPVVSFLGPAIAGILTGSLVVEKIFQIPGLGTHFVQAAINRDYTLSMGCVLLYTTLVYLMNLLVDVGYTVLDPRVELD